MGCGFGYAERTECAIGWEGAMGEADEGVAGGGVGMMR